MRTILICLLCVFLAGCSASHKLAVNTQQTATDKTVSDMRSEQNREQEETSVTTTATAMTETGEEVTIRREYDTTRPADSTTGKPPLISETFTHRKAARDIRQQQADTTGRRQQEQSLTQDNTHYDTQVTANSQAQTETTRRPSWTTGLLLAAVVIIIIKLRAIWKQRNWNVPW